MSAMYLQWYQNPETAAARYFELYPERHQPHKISCEKMVMKWINFGAFEKPRVSYNKNNEYRDKVVLEALSENP